MTIRYVRQSFDPSCPTGGSFFACDYGSMFVGCCTGDNPCGDAGCSAGDLQPASFVASAYGTFADQLCNAGSQWYTCAGANPSFMGCCQSDACSNNGCPAQDLTPGILQSVPALNSAYDPISNPGATSSAVASSTSAPMTTPTATSVANSQTSIAGTPTSTGTSAEAFASSTSSPTTITSQRSSGPHTAAIAGGAVGGVAVLGILLVLLLWYCRRNVRASRRHMDDSRAFSGTAGIVTSNDASYAEKVSPSMYTYQTPDSLMPSPHSAAASPPPPAYHFPAELHHDSSPAPSFRGFPSPPRSSYGMGIRGPDELHLGEAERFMTVSPALSTRSPVPYRDVELSELDARGSGRRCGLR
ncbi:hypothetical protein MMC32_006242 [Xylographa parallela]|nr:hypothetical protein [Xylographa parallela]